MSDALIESFTRGAWAFLREVEALKLERLCDATPREMARPRETDTLFGPTTSFHADSSRILGNDGIDSQRLG
jgi:hypothetical protein